MTFWTDFGIIIIVCIERAAQAVKGEGMITDKRYKRIWDGLVIEYYHCYPDENGKHPCDKGVLCDACENDTMVDLLWEGIKKMNNRANNRKDKKA